MFDATIAAATAHAERLGIEPAALLAVAEVFQPEFRDYFYHTNNE